MNKTEKGYVELYNNVSWNANYANHLHYSVKYFYTKPSQEKIDIELSILEKMHEEQGYGYKVLCGNGWAFTCAYLVNVENDHLWLKVFTKNKMHKILMED